MVEKQGPRCTKS